MKPVIYLSGNQSVKGLDGEQLKKLKEALTFNNPAYANAKRYSRSRYISIPPYLEYFKENIRDGSVSVPIGVNVSDIIDSDVEYVDNRTFCEVKYPPFLLELREDQIKAKNSFISEQKNQIPKNLIHLPTGKGKTILALNLASTLKQKTLVLVHKDDLVTGWQNDIKLCFGDKIEPGLIKAKKRKIGKQITIATVQTLSRMSEEELSTYLDKFGLVIQDECHHIGLNIFNLINLFKSRYKLGLSATPKRSDGLDFVFTLFLGGIGYKHEYTKDDEDILPVKVIVKKARAKYHPFLYGNQVFNRCDFKEEDLPDDYSMLVDIPYEERPQIPFLVIDNILVSDKKHIIQVCHDIIKEYKKGHSCIAFFTQKEHIEKYYSYLKHFVSADKIMMYYGDSKEKSSVLMKKAEDRECLITLATYAKATEGTNVKAWEVGFLVSSLNNEKNVEQVSGRIRRSNKGKLNPVLLYDYRFEDSYLVLSHGVTRDRVYKKLKFEREGDISIKVKGDKKMFGRGFRS